MNSFIKFEKTFYYLVMLRGLRGSNSVCARIIQRDGFSRSPDTAGDSAGENSLSSRGRNTGRAPRQPKRRRARWTVRVLDVAESARCGQEKFIPFEERLHPWTSIKVRTKSCYFRGYKNGRHKAGQPPTSEKKDTPLHFFIFRNSRPTSCRLRGQYPLPVCLSGIGYDHESIIRSRAKFKFMNLTFWVT